MKALACVAILVLAAGCGDSSSSKPQAEEPRGESALSAPADYVGAVGAAQKRAAQTLDLTPVKRAIQQFRAAEGRYPNSLQELVTEGHLSAVPRAPAGTQFQYDPRTGSITVSGQK